jgi:hypothetical protein
MMSLRNWARALAAASMQPNTAATLRLVISLLQARRSLRRGVLLARLKPERLHNGGMPLKFHPSNDGNLCSSLWRATDNSFGG